MFAVLPLDSGQCLFQYLPCRYTYCIAHTSEEMAAETSSGPIVVSEPDLVPRLIIARGAENSIHKAINARLVNWRCGRNTTSDDPNRII